jgi:hypothetical protein
VLVAMPETPGPGPSPLKEATKEIDLLSLKGPDLKITAFRPPVRRKGVLELLRSCDVFTSPAMDARNRKMPRAATSS